MDIDSISAGALSDLAQERVRSQVDTRVARLAMDQAQAEGDAAVKLIQAAAEAGKGGQVDVTA